MNKKILSFVLAMVFSLSLGCGSLFAVDYYGVGSVGSADGSVTQFGGEAGSVTLNANDIPFAEAQNDKLTTMFGYIAGTMTFMGNKTSITFTDANGAKAGFSISENAQTGARQYTITSFNLNGSDIQAVKAAGGLKEFLLKSGISEDALKTPKTNDKGQFLDAKGNVVSSSDDAAMVDVAWLKEAENYLSAGINMSASISFGATGGAQVTISENRLPQITLGSYAGNFMVMSQYNYVPGTSCLESVVSAQIKANTSGEGIASYSLEYNKTTYDQFGRQSETWLLDKDGNTVDYNVQKQEKTTDANGRDSYEWVKTDETKSGPIGTYTYSSNSSILAYTDNTSGQTYLYNGGQIDSVVTGFQVGVDPLQQGFLDVKTKYNYVGGVLDNVVSYNNGTPVSMTVCDAFGRQLGTVSMTNNPNMTSAQARNEIDKVLRGNAGKDSPVQSVTLYKDMLGISAYKAGFAQMGITDKKLETMNRMNYGYNSSVASISLSYGTKTETTSVAFSEKSKDSYDKGKASGATFHSGYNYYGASGTVTTTTTSKTLTYTCTISSHGQSVEQFQKENILSQTVDVNKAVTDIYDPAVVGTVKDIVTIDGKQYAVLKDAQVDIADGNGFQSADGEEIYVCIDDLSDDQKKDLKPGATFAAAGYIDTSVEGHYAINNLYESKIGKDGESVDNMVQSFSATLAGNSEYQANVQANMVTFAKAAADGKTYKDWKGGWELLLQYGGGAPAQF